MTKRAGNGDGSLRSRNTKTRGVVWDVQMTGKDPQGLTVRVTKRGFESKKLAQDWRDEQKRRARKGELGRTAPLRVPDICQLYIESRVKIVRSTSDSYRSSLKRQIRPRLNIRADQLTQTRMQAWIDETQDLFEARDMTGSGAVKTGVNLVRASMRWAASPEVRLIPYNPLDRKELEDPTKAGVRRAFTKKQLRLLFAESRRLSGILWRLIFETGARKGEILGLDWEDLNLHRRRVSIGKIATPESSYKKVASRTKGKKVREVPLSRALVALLVAYRDELGESATGPIFVNQRGTRAAGRTVDIWWAKDLAAAGMEGRHIHELRHTWATMAIRKGVDIKLVSEVLGHSKISTTLDIYHHTSKKAKREAIELVSGLI